VANSFKEVLAALEVDPTLAAALAAAPESERAALLVKAGVTVPSKEDQDEYLREHPEALNKIKIEGESTSKICSIVT
jgi:2-oxo-4-hydroxy-4-carboxy--5-ureidoimidazoline (OHCU) decarboxylase